MEKETKVLLINGVKILESTNIDINEYQSSEEYPNQWADEEAIAYNYGLDEEDKNYGQQMCSMWKRE